MKRRDVIKLGAAATAGAALAGTGGCGARQHTAGAATAGAADPEGFLAQLDRQLGQAGKSRFVSRFVDRVKPGPRSPEVSALLAEKDAMFRRMLRALLITQGFRDQTPETQLAPEVQARMWDHMDEVDETVFVVSDMLARLDTTGRDGIKRALRDNPELPMAIGEALDARAATAGIPVKRRRQLRSMMSKATFRLRHGDPGTLIDEYVGKVERLKAKTATDARAIALAEQIGEREFWRYQHLVAGDGGAGPAATAGPPPGGPGSIAPEPRGGAADREATLAQMTRGALFAAQRRDCAKVQRLAGRVYALDRAYYTTTFARDAQIQWCLAQPAPAAPKQENTAGRKGLRVGGYLLGIGVITFVVSIALVSSAEGFIVGATVGAILIAVGFVVLLISALIAIANS